MLKKNYENIRQKNIYALLNEYSKKINHAKQVAFLSLLIFDKTKGILHNFTEKSREILEYGALLHDIGYAVSSKNHHKNAYKIIVSKAIEGFSEDEIELIANIARYHRGKLPCEEHANYTKLEDTSKDLVSKLGGIVRLADGFDKSNSSIVKSLDFSFDKISKSLEIQLDLPKEDCYLEIYASNQKKDLMEVAYNVSVELKTK